MQRSIVLFLYFTTLVLVFGLDFIRIAQNRYKSALTSNGIKPHSLIKSALSIPPHVRLKDELNAEEIVLRSTPEIIRYRGFPVEEHSVITEDGYILTLHRVPPSNPGAKVVFLQHGAFTSDALWVIQPQNRSLLFLLVENGYDVWMGNWRGSRPSTGHISLSSNDSEYWDFSMDEIAKYDIPTSLNYVLNVTRKEKLSFIAYSTGCASFFAAMVLHPELNERIDVMFALAPAVFFYDVRTPAGKALLPLVDLSFWIMKVFGMHVVKDLNKSQIKQNLVDKVCLGSYLGAAICRERLSLQGGHNRKNFDLDLLPALYKHWSTGASVRWMIHMIQQRKSGESFRAYDYGPKRNLEKYGSKDPIEYDLRKVTAPVIIFWAENDYVVGEKDIYWLARKLSNIREIVKVSDPKFAHFDYKLGLNVKEVVYDKIISLLYPQFNVN